MGNYSNIPDDGLWDELKKHEGATFTTSGRGSRPGISFTYTIRGGEMFVSTKTRFISKATVYRAYENATFLQ